MAVKKIKTTTIDSTIDMRINKSDIIELMMAEEEERLNNTCKELELKLEAQRDEAKQEIITRFKTVDAFIFIKLEQTYGELETIETCYRQVYFTSKTSDFQMRVPFSKEQQVILNKLGDELREAQVARREFHSNKSKYKAALTRKMLEASAEGQDILKKLKEVKVTIALPEGK